MIHAYVFESYVCPLIISDTAEAFWVHICRCECVMSLKRLTGAILQDSTRYSVHMGQDIQNQRHNKSL